MHPLTGWDYTPPRLVTPGIVKNEKISEQTIRRRSRHIRYSTSRYIVVLLSSHSPISIRRRPTSSGGTPLRPMLSGAAFVAELHDGHLDRGLGCFPLPEIIAKDRPKGVVFDPLPYSCS